MSIFTAARKITAARVAGACTAAGVISYLTKEAAIVCPVAGVVVTAALVAHRKLAKENISEVSAGGLAVAATVCAGQVAVGSAAGIAAKRYLTNRGSKASTDNMVTEQVDTAPTAETVEVVEVVAAA